MFGQQQISIEQYLANLDARKATLQLQLSQVNTQMSNIRAHYEQSRANFLFKQSPHTKDHQLKKLQPTKEKLQKEMLHVRAEIARVKALKKQGIQSINI